MENKSVCKRIDNFKGRWLKSRKNLSADNQGELNGYEKAQRASADAMERKPSYKERR